MGSKSKIADAIISALPSGRRFVDLFGGGFAMSHCALLSHKYDGVLYNEINPLLPALLKRVFNGDISHEWVTRERFQAEKEKDGFIKYIWSFGSNGHNYLYAKEIEDIKRAGHEFCLHGTPIKGLNVVMPTSLIGHTITDRRLILRATAKDEFTRLINTEAGLVEEYAEYKRIKRQRVTHVDKCERLWFLELLTSNAALQQLERLECLERSLMHCLIKDGHNKRLQITCGSYTKYKHQRGDIVYCDPPYMGCAGYNPNDKSNTDFNSVAFFDWAYKQPYPIYISHYPLTDEFNAGRFYKLFSVDKRQMLNGQGSGALMEECVYVQLPFKGMA